MPTRFSADPSWFTAPRRAGLMILTQPQSERRDRLANLTLLRRLADYSARQAQVRGAAVLVAVVVTATSARLLPGLLLCLPAVAGLILNLVAILLVESGPGNAVMRWYDDHLARTEGNPTLNLPAFVESFGAVLLFVVPAWVLTDLTLALRLIVLTAATVHACSVSCSIFDDNAWYNPDVRAPRWQEVDRILAGPQVAVLVFGIGFFAPWPEGGRTAVVVLAAWSLLIPLRVSATQHLTRDLGPLVEEERQRGTRLVIEETTRTLLPPLREAVREAAALGPRGGPVADLANEAIRRVNDIPRQIARAGGDEAGDPLDVVAERLASLAASTGARFEVQVPSRLDLTEPDRTLASLAMRDLAGNAIMAGAEQIALTVRRLGRRIMVIVADDGRPMPSGAWKSPGTSSAALERRLQEREGSLTIDAGAGSKTVTASWLGARDASP